MPDESPHSNESAYRIREGLPLVWGLAARQRLNHRVWLGRQLNLEIESRYHDFARLLIEALDEKEDEV
jgi:hypothetical protein